MIDLILSLIGGFKGLIIGGIGLLGGIWALWMRHKVKSQADTINQQERAIGGYKAKEEVTRQDQGQDADTTQRIDELRNKMEKSENPANEIANTINDYFGKVDK